MALKAAANMFKASAPMVALSLIPEGVAMIRKEIRKRERVKTNKALDSMMNEGLQELNNKIKALHENFKKLEESTKNELQIIRAELEKNQGEKENEIARGLESVLNKHLLQLSQRIQTLEEDLQKWPETTKNELQIIRGYLENQGEKENEIARGLESVLNKHLLQLSQRIQTLEEDVQKWPETTKHELQIIRGYLENQEKKKEERSRALETELQQLSQRIQTLEEDLQKWPETTKHELQIIRGYLENQEKKKEERSRALETELQQLSPTIQALGQLFRQDFPYHVFLPFRAYLENNQGLCQTLRNMHSSPAVHPSKAIQRTC
ncbi:golgin subfamily A member 5-like isoform X6 [Motacilla alba alba]|uniref:golgin subfamily A member 5-like isoform X6 n=1 Tax=Motacilla alba alba TaxID=1094192 RepID=UPI0018D50139|nr:golgin subfamily A member 5-like isoform X6 [Motacilla alba alba]